MIHEGSPGDTRSLWRWEGFVENVCFEPGVKDGVMDAESGDGDKDGSKY